MSHSHPHEDEPAMDEDEQAGDDAQLNEEDIVEVHDDSGDEPMDDEDDGDDDEDDKTNYAGEIVIGAPTNAEEEEEYLRSLQDNSLNATSLHAAEKSVFTVALHPHFPNPPLAISGGEDDLAYLFSPVPSSSQHPFSADSFPAVRLTGHTDSVVAAGWSFDGEMVATGGMDGRVRVWRRVKGRRTSQETNGPANGPDAWKNWEFITSLETGSEITWLTWHPKGNVLSAGCEDATVWMWNLPSGDTMTVLAAHTLSTTAGVFPSPGKTLLTASLDSTLIHWDPRTSQPLFKSSIFCPPNDPELDPSIHGITALAVAPNGQIAAVGGSAGAVKAINLTKGDVVGNFIGHAEGESVEALMFVDLLSGLGGSGGKGVVLVSGATDGKGFVWDLATGRVRAELKHDEPITSLAGHPAPNIHLVTSASADSTLKTWDIRTGALIAEHKGHQGVVNGLAVGPSPDGQGQVILSAGDEGVSLLWKVSI